VYQMWRSTAGLSSKYWRNKPQKKRISVSTSGRKFCRVLSCLDKAGLLSKLSRLADSAGLRVAPSVHVQCFSCSQRLLPVNNALLIVCHRTSLLRYLY
jgi:hypothetical protein